ncbi:flavoprotein [Actinoplanes utahensis]|uniref:flavoprotein n=1 Tax=Actinoplanes utahensis TaxID=1869 RepID=UPI0006921ECB|nr:flavoprotein [Actinoplanes utahensis]GIF33868.1 hypothetical protein Aut01nite_68540 [Actinoplanes utahensis]
MRLLHLVVCAATPLRHIGDLLALLTADWQVQVIATPSAATWPFLTGVESLTGRPLLHRMPRPDEPWPVPPPDAILAAPITFNTVGKLATGVNDNLAVGVLNEHLGGTVPMVLATHAKPELRAHPAFTAHLRLLAAAGVTLTTLSYPLDWPAVTRTLAAAPPRGAGHDRAC